MGCRRLLIRLGILFTSIYLCHGCQLEGVSNLPLPVSESFLDTFRGTILNRTVSEIEGINSVSDAAGVNFGPYVDVILTGTHFAIVTNDAFENYEEYETSDTFSITITFACTGSSTRTLVFVLTVIDTNNNAPRFTPSNEIEFTIAPPVPPGFVVTGCLNDIIARDIDLTTQRIEFIIEENPYFEIAYDEASSTEAKEFKATLRTTTLIRSFPEPIILTITATDVDLTGDPPLTTAATLRILGDTGFEFPEEPVFSQPFYLANYTIDNQITHESIALEQGFDEQVQFVLQGEYASNFGLAVNGGQLILSVISPLPTDVFVETQIVLVVRASREYTSGATTAIIVQLPKAESLEFERVHYEGSIVNNVLQVPQLTLLQGYDDSSLLVLVRSEYSQYFATAVEGNLITLTMSPLPEGIIEENNFIYLEIVASTDHSSASTIVTIEIIKDDNVTPVFDSPLYTGTYESNTGLSVQQILIVQGYDDTVTLDLEGTHASYFQLFQAGNVITLTSSTIPPAIYAEQQIILTVVASKPRTVGANAVVLITLPTARELRFDSETEYRGSLRNNEMTLTPINLIEGYDDTVTFSLSGGFASYFRIIQSQNQAVVELATSLLDEVILTSHNIILTITAAGLNAVSRSATIVLDVVKDDVNTPVFSQNIYQGLYSNSFTFEVEDINLEQGYDELVSFRIVGDHAQYFDIGSTGNSVNILLRSAIPEELILNEKLLSFTILAEKELTVGANAAVLIKFPLELTEPALMRFSQNNYNGTIDSSSIDLESIVLDTGYADGTVFTLIGDYASYFALSNNNNIVSLTLENSLPQNVLEDANFIVLDLTADRQRAISTVATLVFDIIKVTIIPPIFGETYYRGVYTVESGLQFNEEISLSTGYDETVVFFLDGEFATWFTLRQINNNNMTLEAVTSVPENILINNNQLIFTIVAIKSNAQSAQATISLDVIRTEIINPEFEQAYYTGSYSMENGLLFEDEILLSQGHDETVTFGLDGDLSTWFSLVQFNATTFTLISSTAVPIDILENYNQLLFTVVAYKPSASNARAVVSLDVIRAEVIPPVFSESFYSGMYTEETGLIFTDDISLSFGYDETVTFRLEGVLEPWLSLVQNGNSLTLVAIDHLPEDVLQNNNQLLFSILAEKPNTVTGQATIFIDLPKDIQERRVLSFEENTYVGALDNGEITLPTIALRENHGDDTQFNIYGDYASYFSVYVGTNTVTLQLINELPDDVVRNNVFITFDLVASSPGILSGYSTVVLELIKEVELQTATPIFEQAYYTGEYAVDSGLTFEYTIQLIQGFDETVFFNLDGDDSQWFAVQEDGNNNLTLTLIRIPEIEDRSNLVFSIIANKTDTLSGHAAVIITITDFYTQSLRFTQDFYTGYFDSENITISDEIRIQEGNIVNLVYSLNGDYSNYFQLTNQGGMLTLQLLEQLPEEIIHENSIILLTVEIQNERSRTHATIILENVIYIQFEAIVEFEEPYYIGTYSELDGLTLDNDISLSRGYEENVIFNLDGNDAQYFALVRSGNSVTLTLVSPIPAAVLNNNRKLVFVITAQRAGSVTARSTIIISLVDDYTEGNVLGFDRVTYVGSIENNLVTVQPITLSEGYTNDVVFSLHGELADYFSVSSTGAAVTIALQSAIPEQALPANRMILLEIQASLPATLPAYATVIFEVIVDEDLSTAVEMVFNDAYYIGTFTEQDGLAFTHTISLSEGYDDSVAFALDGDDAQYFALVRSGNSVTLTLVSPIPAAVLNNNRKLVFVITAQRAGSVTARSTIIISLVDDYTEGNVLGFDRVTYVGSIENNLVTVQPITLSEGYTNDVVFSLHGELADYFSVSSTGAAVTIALQSAIPEQALPANRMILLEIQASLPATLPAYATVIFEVIVDEDLSTAVEMVFNDAYYIGTFREQDGLAFTHTISLSEGYDDSVAFALDGDDAQYFALVRSGNLVTLTLVSPIPAAVLNNNRKLVFVITAQRAGSVTARSTIIISLVDEYTEGNVLGFDRVTYVGSIENNLVTVQPITLSEGYTNDVVFSLHGELADYFSVSSTGAAVTIALQSAIPEQALPANRMILLEIQASLPATLPAYATVIFEVIVDEDLSTAVEMVFNDAYYIGTFTEQDGLAFTHTISLSEGYDDSVAFALDGDDAQYFALVRSGNSVTLTLVSPIPAAVLNNNRKLVFVITAQRAGSVTARSTIIISLVDDYTEGNVLGFDRVTYVGSIENNLVTVQPITLSEGYTNDVVFSLHGELADYFSVSSTGAAVTIALQSAIPEQALPANRMILLEIQASLPATLPAYATVIFEVIVDEDLSTAVEMVFNDAYYIGTFTEQDGLAFTHTISLSEGYDDSVAFALDGDDAQYFALVRSGNSVTLALVSPIPAAVLNNNRKLVFVITAQRAGSVTARSTIIISLVDEYTEGNVLGFDRVTYVGSIENNLVTVQPITLSEGYTNDVVFSLHGELADYFSVSSTGAAVTIALQSAIPEQALPANRMILLEIQASLPATLPAYATVIFEVIVDEDLSTAVEMVFNDAYYIGTFTEQDGLAFTHTISLSEGYDDSVAFALDGDDAQYFALVRSGNSVTLTLVSPIPAAVLNNNRKLVFVITAQRAGSVTARSTIIISLVDDYTEGNVLGFDRVTYVGSIENNLVTVQPITLSEGYTNDVVFSLHGELADYFSVSSTGAAVTIALQSAIPEQALPANRMILLEIQASLPATLPAYATVIFEVIVDEDLSTAVEMVFNDAYYIGTFREQDGLAFTHTISLSEGYDDSVAFALDGDDAQYFALVRSGNSVTLTLVSPIPAAVLNNNRKLVFVITAQRAGSVTARSTIIISLVDEYTEGNVLGFDRVTYVGSIENNLVTVQPITLSEGYTNDVVFSLHGELADYFSVSSTGAAVTIALQSAIPEQALPANRMILLEIQASLPATLPAYATVIFEVIVDEDLSTAVEMVFNDAYYIGTFTEQDGLAFTHTISLSEGYDDSVAFALDGDDAQYFALVRSGNSVTLTLVSPIPAAVLNNNRKLVFVITAQRAGSVTARSTIIISLVDEYTEGNVLGFDRVTYVGSIENNLVTVQPITLSEGYTNDVVFSLHGELADYFSVSSTGAAVTIALQSAIPEQALPANRMILLEIQASLPATLPAYATVIFEVIVDEDLSTAVEMVFNDAYYIGTFTEQDGLAFTHTISLSEGYDDSVAFALDGDDAQYFALVRSGNSVTLTLVSPIPAAVLNNNRKLVFVITAQRAGSVTARSTIIISLVDEYTEGNVLGFDRVTYVGSIENNLVTVQPITLSEGYTNDVVFSLHGELADYFSVSSTGAAVTIALQSAIPEQALPANRMILLEIQASLPATLPAYATVIFEVIVDEDLSTAVEMVFNDAYYIGTFTEQDGLAFTHTISLSEGYDDSVAFALDGDDAQYFALVRSGNSVTLTLVSPIPAAVLNNNRKLVFVITAQRAGSVTARSTIIISLVDDYTEGNVLGFDRVTYVGSIENNLVTVQPITLSEGYTNDVVFSLHGELADYFSVSSTGAAVTIALQSAIPEQALPANRMILLEIQASLPATLPAYATVIFEVIVDEDLSTAVEMVFNDAYYIGTFREQDGLAFTHTISLSEGYDDSVAFALDGDDAQYFALVRSGNSVTLTLVSPIPAAVLNNNRKLVFVITAQRAGSVTARSTIIISLVDDYTEGNVLGFDRVTYVGSIENNLVTVQPITLSEGYTNDVVFSLHGELADYFSVSSTGAAVTIALQSAIPEQALPANRMILLEIQASLPATLPAYATVIFEVIVDEDLSTAVEMVFNDAYYIGTFSEQDGLAFTHTISLSEGYDDSVAFALDGDDAQYFALVRSGNSVTLTLVSPIPAAVLNNNRKLVFVITAQRAGSVTARSTIIISLVDDYTEGNVLGFDRVTYVGSIENNLVTVQPITLSEGYTNDVVFSLHGELADYFSVSSTGAAVTIALQSAIPEQALPANRMILLEIQASLPATLPAYATVIFEVIVDEDLSTAVEMVFNDAYYIGTFTEQDGLAFTHTISLSEGYDDSVAFALDGDDAQYFALVRSGNSVTLTLVSPIPAAVLNNNRKLVFVITAQRAGSVTARSTIIISLVDDYTEGNVLGFDRVTYVGSIENNLVTVQPITLSEGYTNDVVFSLHGELADYFSVSSTGAAVTIALQSAIPEQALPSNRMILLEIQASLPATLPAYATVIFEVIVDEDLSTAVEMVFNDAYYIGTFTEQDGLAFTHTISLSEGYDDSVAFALDGDDAQYFALVRSGNSVTLTLVSPIPAAVLNNNRKLVFVITAQRAGSVTARSTIIISLVDDYTEGNVLGFDRVTYVGSIENNLVTVQPITLSEGYTNDVVFSLHGELADYFSVSSTGAAVTIALQSAIPEQALPANRMILLEIQASLPATLPAYATVIFEVIVDEDLSTAVEMVFNDAYYIGTFTEQDGLAFTHTISLSEGYDDSVAFALDGDDAQYFALVRSGNSVTLTLVSPIPAAVLNNNRKLVFVITAQRAGSVTARSTIVISIVNGSDNCTDETFEKLLYEGVIQAGVVQHETIIILGYSGNDVQIFGEYAGAFVALVSNGEVSVQTGSVTLPAVTHLALELRAGGASAVLLLTVLETGPPVLPTVTFSSISYALQVDIDQTGLVGRVDATADNGESIAYSLITENAHLQSRLSINTAGELHLSAPVNIDFYNLEVIATTTITQVSATAPVYLTVNAVTVCGDNNVVTPPLIILNRDEEESHMNLVVINETEFQGCRYNLVNRWPVDQTWLYVDETGLHTTAIDREHESIAFMALSQVQVELTLNCDSDQTYRRSKRSMDTPWLGPYDYGTKDWILTDTILFNSRRSLVSLIVNDINDNAPVFVGKEYEPIIVGYPVPELEDTVLPRSLAQLKATDADIGVNAELRYWSADPQLAVAPSTGYVHVRDGARLEHDARLNVLATDRNGDGLSGSIELQVKLLDNSHIIVVTVRDAFLDDEETILDEMSSAVGYEIKTLRSSVISDDVEIVNTRKNRDTIPAGASLQIYAYGLIDREPVEIQQLITDLSNNAVMMVNVASILSLEDHLEAQEICVIPGRDTGLLVATIVLSVLLFILIVAVVIWIFRKRLCRCGQNYQEFSDENSLASRNDSMAQLPKPEIMTKPRLDIEELKRSEKRLQDMLNAPIPEVAVQPSNSKMEPRAEAIIDMPQNDVRTPIVIQSIDKLKDADDDDTSEDEFGENPKPRRKSVVTFNENVEKIIHVDDNEDQDPDPEYEVYRF